MKRLIIITVAVILSLAVKTNATPNLNYQDFGGGVFYSALAPYGTWIELDGGVVVWRPLNLQIGWAPYRNGQWIWTRDGWYWDSYDPFGYIVFHYGRWYYDDYYGWIWVPDDVWAPAWVQWRYDNDYIGWAPLPPYASFSIGIGIHFTHDYITPYRYWHFVRYGHMCSPHVYNYFAPEREKFRIYSVTRYRTNYGYSNGRVINRGVDVDYVRRRGGSRIIERSIERVDSPRNTGFGRDNVVRAYIPPRDQIRNEHLRNENIRRGTRPSTMQTSRVEIGRNTDFRRNANDSRNNEIRRQDNINRPSREATPRSNDRGTYRSPERGNEAPQIRKESNRNNRIENNNRNRNTRPEVRRESQPRRTPQVRRAPETKRESRGNTRDKKQESKNNRRR